MAYRLVLIGAYSGPAALGGLPPVQQQQLLDAARRDLGADFADVADFCAKAAKEMGEDPEEMGGELWDVVQDGETAPRYHFWYFPATDDGTVYLAGTAKFAGIHMIQTGFEAIEAGPGLDALARELQTAYDTRRRQAS